MYAMSLAFVIFISVNFAMQMQTISFTQLQKGGVRLRVSAAFCLRFLLKLSSALFIFGRTFSILLYCS